MPGSAPLLRHPHGPPLARLARREREVAEIVYACGRGITADEVRLALSDPLSNSAVRSMLTRLAAKGLLATRKAGKKFVYLPAIADDDAREKAILRLAQDYFAGSLAEAAMATLALARRRRPATLDRVRTSLEASAA
ncbi:MAG TPA: BlaI/MecI/CopY family transcriptional regulator [Allosphingosinicella sp.]|nr:BlaI/MecI/CopY family transcriptional regulator [Allosphingosinicella sp.]